MNETIIMLFVYGVPLLLYLWYRITHPKQEQLIYTPDLDNTLEKVQQIREQLNRLERLQTELDIADMDNCFARSICLNWGNREDDNYIFQLLESDTSDLQNLIEKERIRLTTSLTSELSKLPRTVKSKGEDKAKNYSRGEGFRA